MFRDLRVVAKAAGASAAGLERALRARVNRIARRLPRGRRRRVFCMEWLDPVFTTGHWVPELVERAGGRDGLARAGAESRAIPWSDVRTYAPETLILMPCGFEPERTLRELPALTRRRGWAALPAVKRGEVYVADGPSYFNGAGPRLVDGLEILAEILHPALFSAGPWRAGYRRLERREIDAAPPPDRAGVRRSLERRGTAFGPP